MKRVLVFLLILLAGQSLAKPVECDNNSLRITLMSGEVGETLTEDNFHGLSAGFMAVVDSANANQCRIVVEVSNDPAKWRVLRLMAQDPRYQGVNFETMNLVLDAALNVARRQVADQLLIWIGVSSEAEIEYRPLRDNTCFVKIYSAPLRFSQQPRIVEHIVEKPASSNSPSSTFQLPQLPKLGLSLHVGATSTWKNAAPMAALSLRYNNSMVQAYGFHSLFLSREQNALGTNRDVYDQGVGLLVGKQIDQSLWLMVGYERQEIVLDDGSDQSGRSIFWFQGGELGLMWLGGNHFATLTCIYGHSKEWNSNWDQTLETDAGLRLAVGLRLKGGK